jgi:hypothetical protein
MAGSPVSVMTAIFVTVGNQVWLIVIDAGEE